MTILIQMAYCRCVPNRILLYSIVNILSAWMRKVHLHREVKCSVPFVHFKGSKNWLCNKRHIGDHVVYAVFTIRLQFTIKKVVENEEEGAGSAKGRAWFGTPPLMFTLVNHTLSVLRWIVLLKYINGSMWLGTRLAFYFQAAKRRQHSDKMKHVPTGRQEGIFSLWFISFLLGKEN